MIDGAPVNIVDFGSGTEVGALLQAAIDSGAKYIQIPDATNWTWTTKVVLPELWRGRIVSLQSKAAASAIVATTGNNNPCIDAQGALFVELDGFNVLASNTGAGASACFVVFARMPSGASSSNHRVVNNIIEGPFYYCSIYNCGGEELYFQNNYVSIYGTLNSVQYRTACVVHTLTEESYFSGIVTKASRANGSSCSAIQHAGDNFKNFNVGGSAIYVGPNTNDITFDLSYGYTADNSYFLSLGGYFNNIKLGAERVETTKNSPIVYSPVAQSSGSVILYKGSYLRGGAVNAAKSAVSFTGGTTSNTVTIIIDSGVSWTTPFTSEPEDIYLINSVRKTICDVSFLGGGLTAGSLYSSVVTIAFLLNSSISMGLSSNLIVSTYFGANKFWFFGETSNPGHVFNNGAKFQGSNGVSFTGQTTTFNASFGAYPAITSVADSVSTSIHSYFYNPNGVVGSITSLGSATSYLTSSDPRLKTITGKITPSNAKIFVMALQPKTGTWNSNGEPFSGFLTNDYSLVDPPAVFGKSDAVDEKGNPVYQQMEYGSMAWCANMTALVQSLTIQVDALNAKVNIA